MTRATTDCRADRQPRRDGGSPAVRIDDETFEALSVTRGTAPEKSPRIARWLDAWTGVDR